MLVTGLIIAERASAVDGKLNMTGGVVTSGKRRPGEKIYIPLVLLTQADDNRNDTITVLLHSPDGRVIPISVPVPEVTQSGRDAGFMVHPFGLPPEAPDGRYVFVAGNISVPLTISTVDDKN
ncbi:hypothetical protein [Mycolicibacterium alvei]|uniref:Uncharacterized protein n=1 Tax=Mycolicibacterium alvei TaxID=67081 RepID=A0A6N4UV22_9MYCO|nr:hypothetical protein [Mycolicibacterium alvei]MCV6999859.1 hypothetical protein [Mycolicibacterium alvei]BBX27504.1 hypothetical protein MALV_26290 [Mycolicibacterium alvei]